MADVTTVGPLTAAPDTTVTLPGSKSITNRALAIAALADGTSRLDGALLADDTEAMLDGLARLGARVEVDRDGGSVLVTGTGGQLTAGPVELDARESGTTARFLAAMVALGSGRYRIDAAPAMRARPMVPVAAALRALGLAVEHDAEHDGLPMTIAATGVTTDRVTVGGDVSSQFLSGLLLMAPALADGLAIDVTTDLVSRPYVELTRATMAAFGAHVRRPRPGRYVVAPASYRAARYRVEPDATAASYFLAAAAICGGRVQVAGLGRDSRQGDVGFAAVLARMGASVSWPVGGVEVRGTGNLHGIEVDLADLSDTAQTLAAVAAFATGTTRVTGVGFIRRKETDRIAAVVRELRRCGVAADEEPDGFVVTGGTPRAARVETYGDHRMAMSFALLGLRVPGIEIADPTCVAKTFPDYFATLDRLRQRRPVPPR